MDTREINETLARIGAQHHGVITLEQAERAGLTRKSLHHRVRNGTLERLKPGVFRIAGTVDSWERRALSACAAAGPRAVVSHRAAAMWWNLDGFASAPLEVVTDRWLRQIHPDARVHETLVLPDLDRTTHRSIPITTVVRTLIDVAGWAHPFRVEQAWEDALRKRLCTVAQIGNRFVPLARRGRRGIALARTLLEARTGEYVPTGSVFELRMVELLGAHGLPAPQRQVKVVLPEANVYLDLAWPDRLLAIECDGMWDHATNIALPWDAKRQNEVQLLGWLVLRFTWKQLNEKPADVIRQIKAAYDARAEWESQPSA